MDTTVAVVHGSDRDGPNPLWQFDGDADLLPTH
jgi:hypothetical protein